MKPLTYRLLAILVAPILALTSLLAMLPLMNPIAWGHWQETTPPDNVCHFVGQWVRDLTFPLAAFAILLTLVPILAVRLGLNPRLTALGWLIVHPLATIAAAAMAYVAVGWFANRL